MSPHGSYKTPEDFDAAMREVKAELAKQDQVYEQRRKEDDVWRKRQEDHTERLIERIDAHGRRQTVIETQFQAFFGEQGAYKHILSKIDATGKVAENNGKKTDRLLMLVLTTLIAAVGALLMEIIHKVH